MNMHVSRWHSSLCLLASVTLAAASPPAQQPKRTTGSAWPMQVRTAVPYAPTAFPSEGRQHLFYELYLTNFSGEPVSLHRVEVIDPDHAPNAPLARLDEAALAALVRTLGRGDEDRTTPASIPAGGTQIVFLEVTIAQGEPIPRHLAHRLSIGDGVVTMAPISVHHALKILGRPVTGADWVAADGPGSDPDNHHRRGVFIRDGALSDSRRLAIDWKIVRDGKSYRGDEHAAASYFAYGRPLLAIGDARVVRVEDGHPDNPAGHGAAFHPAQPITIDNVGGNLIVLDLGDGRYAHYFHLKTGSVRVKVGDHVHKGQVIGAIGSSGDAREPHVHLEVTDAIATLVGEGVPYVIDHYDVIDGRTGARSPRTNQLPLDDMVIDFGP